MDGDLSLSQSLGGLRIANCDPDTSDVKLGGPSASTPGHSREGPLTTSTPLAGPLQAAAEPTPLDEGVYGQETQHPPAEGTDSLDVNSIGYDLNTFTASSQSSFDHPYWPRTTAVSPPEEGLNHRRATPVGDQAQHQLLPPSRSPDLKYHQNHHRPRRPTSGVDSSTEMSSISGVPGDDIRYHCARTESSQSNGALRHSNSRTTAPAPSLASQTQSTLPHRQISDKESGLLPSTEEWKDKGAAVGVQRSVDAEGKPSSRIVKKGVKDFIFGRTLGEGSYSTVLAATDRQTSREYAIKVLDKKHIIKEKKVKYVNIEKDTLNRLTDHPGIVRLYYTFQDEQSLYFVLDLATGGELLGILRKMTTFDEDCTRFYSAQILDAVEYMHLRGVIHRDLKPENVLMDDQMHVKITDFGTAKILDIGGKSRFGNVSVTNDPLDGANIDRAVSFVGTAEYVSPELLTDKNACKASDLWAFGCIVYQLLAGRPPFKAGNEYQTFQKIVALDYTFPDRFPAVAKDLVQKLLVLDPAKRLSIEAIKRHPFFDGIQWGRGLWKQKSPKLRTFNPNASQSYATGHSERPTDSAPPPIARQISGKPSNPPSTQPSSTPSRPQPRIITELAPPSQLDIDWSPVLTKANERILKLGNMVVHSMPAPNSPVRNGSSGDAPAEAPRKLSRFFGASSTKKRQRLVMITSGGRVILAPSGGDKKESKNVIELTDPDVSWKTQQDAKGYTIWSIHTRDKHFTFEDPKANTGDPGLSTRVTQEWMDNIEGAKDFMSSQNMDNSYSEESQYSGLDAATPALDNESGLGPESAARSHRNMLRKDPGGGDDDSLKGRKRFSKRHSKNGLAAVF